MQLIGHARVYIDGTLPLIGFTPTDLVPLPDRRPPHPDAAPLEHNHTHCLLIPVNKWGDESPWITNVAAVV